MSDLYAMRRANGDWFTFEDHKRQRVPVFHSSHDALMARLRNFGMLLFEPVALDDRMFKEIAPAGGAHVDFCLVKDPFARLSCGRPVLAGQLALLMGKPAASKTFSRNGPDGAVVSSRTQNEWWN